MNTAHRTRERAWLGTLAALALSLGGAAAARASSFADEDAREQQQAEQRFELDRICLLRWVARDKASSFRCMQCHDGTLAAAVSHKITVKAESSHPIEVGYATALSRQVVRPVGQLPKAIVLVDGKVTCTSCHDGRSREPARVAMSMKRSGLCFACHPY